ncbi:uncharacterized protein A4U43_C07F17550 [Asparagus officinalis]|uniref:Uncharacterized protein n=1 Tax=Asparagus officinalis TaxID=4686 RepID=A0A5P1ECQ7_ASPOF|nr:uncharacterized protein A4U43_C07F17550 [Asparagus officinalis]
MCLAKEMAYNQMKSIVACVLGRYAIRVMDKDKCPEQLPSLTLRMKGGLLVAVSRMRYHYGTPSLILFELYLILLCEESEIWEEIQFGFSVLRLLH